MWRNVQNRAAMRGKIPCFSGEEEYNKGEKKKGETGEMENGYHQKSGRRVFFAVGAAYFILHFLSTYVKSQPIWDRVNCCITLSAFLVSFGELEGKILLWLQYKTPSYYKKETYKKIIDITEGVVITLVFIVVICGIFLEEKYLHRLNQNVLTILAFSFFFFSLGFDDLIDEKVEKENRLREISQKN